MPVGNETAHQVDGLTVQGGLALRNGNDADVAYLASGASGEFLANGAQLGNCFTPVDHGLIAWSTDPGAMASTGTMTLAGTINAIRLRLHSPATVTSIHLACSTAGATLTAGQCFAALYRGATGATLIGVTADQAAAWVSTGEKEMALASGPFVCPADDYWVALFANGTTLPQWRTGAAPTSSVNVNGYLRYVSADTGRTTTMPASLGTMTGTGTTFWTALS